MRLVVLFRKAWNIYLVGGFFVDEIILFCSRKEESFVSLRTL